MEVYLIRHTETIVDKDICYGQSDLPLKEPFFKEFDKILNQVKVEQPKIYSSPLSRCSILANYFHLHNKSQQAIKYDNRLKELNFGEWELKKWDEIDPKPLNEWMDDFVNYPVPGGESFTQLYLRVNDFIETTLLKEQRKRPAIIITHAGVIRCFLCRKQNIPLKDAFSLQVNYGSVFKISLDKQKICALWVG
ncbi:MAG: alpha-ribazole phosphatase [Bacteroidales bacterium]|nr:alpha-ribazole phosphatase [Bacteroidales bacterium]